MVKKRWWLMRQTIEERGERQTIEERRETDLLVPARRRRSARGKEGGLQRECRMVSRDGGMIRNTGRGKEGMYEGVRRGEG